MSRAGKMSKNPRKGGFAKLTLERDADAGVGGLDHDSGGASGRRRIRDGLRRPSEGSHCASDMLRENSRKHEPTTEFGSLVACASWPVASEKTRMADACGNECQPCRLATRAEVVHSVVAATKAASSHGDPTIPWDMTALAVAQSRDDAVRGSGSNAAEWLVSARLTRLKRDRPRTDTAVVFSTCRSPREDRVCAR